MSLQEELQLIENDIKSLHEEIGQLQEHHDELFKELSIVEAESKHRNFEKAPVKKTQHSRKDIINNNTYDAEDAPALIHHSHFDPSIEKYFKNVSKKPSPEDVSAYNDEILKKIRLKTAAGSLALKESIFRFGGITAFAINDRLYDTEDDALLGIRFDVLNHTTKRFLKPHYIILRRRQLFGKDSARIGNPWSVFRYTTPAYVPLDRFKDLLLSTDEQSGLQTFVEEVRTSLVLVQYKHDKLEQLADLTYGMIFGSDSSLKVITKLDKDLECRRVLITIKRLSLGSLPNVRGSGPLEIELLCDNLLVETADCRLGDTKYETFVQSMIQGSHFQDLATTFQSVVTYMRKNDLI